MRDHDVIDRAMGDCHRTHQVDEINVHVVYRDLARADEVITNIAQYNRGRDIKAATVRHYDRELFILDGDDVTFLDGAILHRASVPEAPGITSCPFEPEFTGGDYPDPVGDQIIHNCTPGSVTPGK